MFYFNTIHTPFPDKKTKKKVNYNNVLSLTKKKQYFVTDKIISVFFPNKKKNKLIITMFCY